MKTQVTFTIPKKDRWLLDHLNEMVEVKRGLGWDSTLDFEIVRLLKKGVKDYDEDEINRRAAQLGIIKPQNQGSDQPKHP